MKRIHATRRSLFSNVLAVTLGSALVGAGSIVAGTSAAAVPGAADESPRITGSGEILNEFTCPQGKCVSVRTPPVADPKKWEAFQCPASHPFLLLKKDAERPSWRDLTQNGGVWAEDVKSEPGAHEDRAVDPIYFSFAGRSNESGYVTVRVRGKSSVVSTVVQGVIECADSPSAGSSQPTSPLTDTVSRQWSIPSWQSYWDEEMTCPSRTPYLMNHNFSPGRVLPTGVEVDDPTSLVGVSGISSANVSGVKEMSLSNYGLERVTVTIILHCTSEPR